MNLPQRGDVYLVDLNPTKGREQSGQRPVLIVSTDRFNSSGAELVVVLPITSKVKGIPWHVPVKPPEGGLRLPSVVLCEAIRSVSRDRLVKKMGSVSADTLAEVEHRLQILLEL